MSACREAFERWWGDPASLEREHNGYRLLEADNAWRVWRAAWIARG